MLDIDWRTLPNAPEPGTRLCALEDLVPTEIHAFRFAAAPDLPAFQLIAQRLGDGVNVYVNQCPHHWLPMQRADGVFLKWSDTEVMCTHHSAVFDLQNAGRCIMGPCQGSNLIRVPVAISAGKVILKP